MRLAVVSDIHANLHALEAVWAEFADLLETGGLVPTPRPEGV